MSLSIRGKGSPFLGKWSVWQYADFLLISHKSFCYIFVCVFNVCYLNLFRTLNINVLESITTIPLNLSYLPHLVLVATSWLSPLKQKPDEKNLMEIMEMQIYVQKVIRQTYANPRAIWLIVGYSIAAGCTLNLLLEKWIPVLFSFKFLENCLYGDNIQYILPCRLLKR